MTPYIYPGLRQNHQKLYLRRVQSLDLNDLMGWVSIITRSPISLILSKSRKRNAVEPRMMFIGIAMDHPNYPSLKRIGAITNQHHATVIHSRETFKDLYETDHEFKDIVDKIKDKFYGTD